MYARAVQAASLTPAEKWQRGWAVVLSLVTQLNHGGVLIAS